MSANNHPDYEIENDRLTYTINYVKDYNNRVLGEKYKIDNLVEYGLSHYNSDNAEQFNDLVINSRLQATMNQKIKNLIRSTEKPYFARVDFTEIINKSVHKLYIGKISLLREKDNKLVITDWRSPVANLYYEGRLGSASYTCPEGEVKGEISLKRQYNIEKGVLQEIYDIDITTNDDFLQACLGSSKDSRLKDIVSTIQSEQNRVIRADMWKPLIVQGAAGGGKTTIALHRIAYLLYEFENTLTADNFMIIAPNKFFLSYISEVLPELGVENVKQTTFEDLAEEVIGKKYKMKSSHEKLARFVNHPDSTNEEDLSLIKRISNMKSSLEFKDVIEDYIKNIEENFIPKKDFKIDSFTLITYEQINTWFTKDYKHLPLMKRLYEIKKHLVNTLKYEKPNILNFVETKYDKILEDIREDMIDSEVRRKLVIKTCDTRDSLLQKIKKESKTLIKDYLDKIKPLTALEYYKNFFENDIAFHKLMKKYYPNENFNYLKDYSLKLINGAYLEIEDLSPIMLIKYLVYGLEYKLNLKHIIIDEAQDFSLFQLYALNQIAKGSSFTILGDLCQGIHSYRGIKNWSDVAKYVFYDKETTMLTLEQSYRTTIEIMNAANKVISCLNTLRLPAAKPVLRHGEKVNIIEKASLIEIAHETAAHIDSLESSGYKSAAIICKTMDECIEMKSLLKKLNKNIKIITGSEKEYSGGVVIVPSYLVKGLEFDMVIVANASKSNFSDSELDIKLLYIAMTRPLHKLYIYSAGEKAAMLNDI